MAKKKVTKVKIKHYEVIDFEGYRRLEAFRKNKRKCQGVKGNKRLMKAKRKVLLDKLPVYRSVYTTRELTCPSCKYHLHTRDPHKRFCGVEKCVEKGKVGK